MCARLPGSLTSPACLSRLTDLALVHCVEHGKSEEIKDLLEQSELIVQSLAHSFLFTRFSLSPTTQKANCRTSSLWSCRGSRGAKHCELHSNRARFCHSESSPPTTLFLSFQLCPSRIARLRSCREILHRASGSQGPKSTASFPPRKRDDHREDHAHHLARKRKEVHRDEVQRPRYSKKDVFQVGAASVHFSLGSLLTLSRSLSPPQLQKGDHGFLVFLARFLFSTTETHNDVCADQRAH